MHSPTIEELEEANKIYKNNECHLSITLSNDLEERECDVKVT